MNLPSVILQMPYLGPDLEFSMLSLRKNDSKMILTSLDRLEEGNLIGNATLFMISSGIKVLEELENTTEVSIEGGVTAAYDCF